MENYPTTDSTTGKPLPNPSMPIDYGNKSNNISFSSDSGTSQVRPRGKMKRTFSFSYVALILTEWKTIRDFYIARNGTAQSFYWTDPVEKVTYTVRFSSEELIGKNFGHNVKTPLYSCDIKLEEVL